MKFSALSFAVAVLLPAATTADPAGAPEQTCIAMNVSPFNASFPANAEAPLRVSLSGPGGFDDYEMPEVFREVDGGYESAPFTLTAADNAFVRALELTEPAVGPHIVTWGDGDCGGSPSPVDSTKTIVGSFEVTPEAAIPEVLGEFESVEQFSDGGPAPSWYAEFVVNLDESVLRWQDVLEVGIEVDGVLERPFLRGGAHDGKITTEYVHLCGSASISPGVHDATIVGRVNGVELRTMSTKIEIECLEPEPMGCSVSAVNSGTTWWGALATLGLLGWRRRRR